MNSITRLMRAVLDVLDTAEHGASPQEIDGVTYRGIGFLAPYDYADLLQALIDLLEDDLISVTADPIIYEITNAGCDALWALQKAEQLPAPESVRNVGDERWRYAHPVSFNSRQSLADFLRSSRL